MEKLNEYERLSRVVEEVGEERAHRTRELYRALDKALDKYREDAMGHGDFGAYIEFSNIVVGVENSANDDEAHLADDIRRAAQHLDARTLRDKHFRKARSALEDVEKFAEEYERYDELEDELRDELRSLEKRQDELRERAEELEDSLEKARAADEVDASPLRDAVETYNRRVEDEFDAFVRDAPAVEVVAVGERIRRASLLPNPSVEEGDAERLARFVGDETVERVLELADQSDARLSHSFDRPDSFRDAVPRTWLRTADADALKLSYDEAGTVERRADELVGVVSGFASDETVGAVRRVRDIAATGGYERMRRAVVASEEAGDDTETLADELGKVRDEIERVEARAEAIRDAVGDGEQ